MSDTLVESFQFTMENVLLFLSLMAGTEQGGVITDLGHFNSCDVMHISWRTL